MTEHERQMDNECFINVYKSCHGFKPRSHPFFTATEAERKVMFDALDEENERQMEDERQMEAEALNDFNVLIEETIAMGAGDRETALRWLWDQGDFYDDDDFRFEYNLPWKYDFRKEA